MRPLTLSDPALLLAPRPPRAGIPVTSGLVAQWEADTLTLNDGDPVASWPDLSGAGRTATQSVAGQKPTFKTNIWGTKPAVYFDHSASQTLLFTAVPLSNFTVFVVLELDSPVGGAYNLAHLNFGLNSGDQSGFALNGSASAGLGVPHITCRNSSGTEVQNKVMSVPGGGWLTLTKHLATWTYDGSTVTGRSEGVDRTISAGEASYGNNGGNIGFNYAYYRGYLAAIAVYNRVLSGAEISQVESYLNGKYPTF